MAEEAGWGGGRGRDLLICISKKFPGDANAAGSGIML